MRKPQYTYLKRKAEGRCRRCGELSNTALCAVCATKTKDARYMATRRHYEANKKHYASTARRRNIRKYGITIDEYDELLVKQAGVCAICGQHETRKIKGKLISLAVDHDHETGKIRGLLCAECNMAIGLLHESITALKTAINYLQRHAEGAINV